MPALSLPAGLRNILKPMVPKAAWNYARSRTERLIDDLFDPYRRISYSQEGEDLILSRILGKRLRGYYVDVGAFHPKKFSNTYLFYRQGWSGMNIDATPGSMEEFRRVRPRDTNIETAISDKEEELVFHLYSNPVYNALDRTNKPERMVKGLEYVGMRRVRSMRLDELFDQYLPKRQLIDFISIDVEGHEVSVLHSNDWTRFRPSYLCVEERGSSLNELSGSGTVQFLDRHGYQLFAKTFQTLIFRDDRISSAHPRPEDLPDGPSAASSPGPHGSDQE